MHFGLARLVIRPVSLNRRPRSASISSSQTAIHGLWKAYTVWRDLV